MSKEKATTSVIKGKGEIVEQNISETLEKNYMPYAMSVILSRAIPEIDGFKPSHRKLLYTMYKMNLLSGVRTKSANIVGKTMQLNPHGDTAIYETMVRLSRGYEALLHPLIDSKGNFGKSYSRDMAYAASRYTEAKLGSICTELFSDIDKDTIDFVDNYDNTQKEPRLLPVKFPSILVNQNTGIAVSMASSICSFNLKEICDSTIKLIKNSKFDITKTLLAPDFPGGGQLVYDKEALKEIYETGRGRIKIRSTYFYDKSQNCIDIFDIPPTTTSEAIIEKVVDLVKQGKIKEISDIRDETGLNGLKITIDLKKGINPNVVMKRLFKFTPLEEFFSCNFNVLIDNVPRVLGVREILFEWTKFRKNCIKRRCEFDLNKKEERLHLLKGLSKIVLDINKAINIIKNTKKDNEVIPNLMSGFSIDEIQANYIADIKLRSLNKEYLLNKMEAKEKLLKEINNLRDILKSPEKISNILIEELKDVSKKYSKKRKTLIIFEDNLKNIKDESETQDYSVVIFLTKEGYFKKITPISLRVSNNQKLKTGDKIKQTLETTNDSEVMIFTDKYQVYKFYAKDFLDSKASLLGEYLPTKLLMREDERPIFMTSTKDYKGFLILFFKNGKVSKLALSSYQTKSNRKKLLNAYSNSSELVKIFFQNEDNGEFLLESSDGRKLIFNINMINEKTTKNSSGVCVFSLKKNRYLKEVSLFDNKEKDAKTTRFKIKNIPSVGVLQRNSFKGFEQLKFI